jgi:hypothetical protein
MKRTLLILALIICISELNFTQTMAASIAADPGIFIFYGTKSQNGSLKILSDTPWTITPDADWLTFSRTSGNGNLTIGLTVAEYPENIRRVGAFTISGTDASPITIYVIQGDIINCSGGELESIILAQEQSARQSLVLKGEMDFRDFQFIKQKMFNVAQMDLLKVKIVETTEFPGYANTIPENTFQNNIQLRELKLPETCTTIGAYAFEKSNIAKIIANEGLTDISTAAFRYCSNLESINFPKTLTNIGSSAFYGCSKLIKFIIPGGAESINTYSFSRCTMLKSINIPSTVTTIGASAFKTSTEIIAIYAYPTTPVPLSSEVFTYPVQSKATLYVPSGSLNAYQQAPVWRLFDNIVELSTGINLDSDQFNYSSSDANTDHFAISSTSYGYISTDADWIQLAQTSYLGDENIFFDMQANPSNEPRTATITISVAGGEDREVTVTQSGVSTAIPKNETDGDEIKVFLNPDDNNLVIEAGLETVEQVEIYDLAGRLQLQISGRGQANEIELSTFTNGIYLVMVQTKNKKSSFKIIKR